MQIEIIKKKKFAKVALNENIEIFVVHMTFLLTTAIYLAKKTQIISLVAKKV